MVEVFSAGTEPGQVNPMAWIAMAEIGIAIGEQHSKSLDEFIEQPFDYIILPALQAVSPFAVPVLAW